MYKEMNNELTKLQSNLIINVIRLADKYKVDRDRLISTCMGTLNDVALLGSFNDYGKERI